MAGYIRQSTFVDGDTITAALFNNEYNQLVNAFSNTSGHKHDGTTAEGPVIGLIGDAGETSPNNKVLIDTTNNYIEFYVEVSSAPVQQLYIADGAIIPVTDSDIDLGTTSLRFKDTYTDTVTTTGNVSIGGDLTVTGSATISGNLTFGDADTDSINLAAEIDSDIIPNTDGTYDLGSATKEWQDLFIDGTANIDSLVADTADINGGTIDGATIATSDITVGSGKTLNVSAGTLTLADNQISGDKVEGGTIAATTITTLTSTTGNITNVNATTVDSTNLELTNLKAKDGTAAGSIADSTGVVTLASSVLTTTDINGGTIDGATIGGTTAGAVTFTDLSDGTITIAGFADEDNMSSNSATLLPTQQSVKAYVDSQVTAQDLDFQGDTGGALSIDLDSESLTIAGGTGIDTSGATNTLTVAIDSTVATLTGTQTLTNKTLTSPDVNTPDIDGGTIDGTVIGGATPAAGTFTTLTANTSITGTLATAAQPNITSLGTLTGLTTTGDINFGDNDKAIFGAGSDLQIYHDGSFSYIREVGTGDLRIAGASNVQIWNSDIDSQMANFANGGAATLYYAGAAKLATTSTGIDVTGTVTSDGLIVDGNNDIQINRDGVSSAKIFWNRSGTTDAKIELAADENLTIGVDEAQLGTKNLIFRNNASEAMRIDSSGNVGIGGTASDGNLHVRKTGVNTGITNVLINASFADGSNGTGLSIGYRTDETTAVLAPRTATGNLAFYNYDGGWSESMRITNSGNVGIGTTSPSVPLDIKSTNSASIKWQRTGVSAKEWGFVSDNDQTYLYNFTDSVLSTSFANNGNVGIGTSSPNSTSGFTTLTLNNATTGGIIDFENNTSLVGRIYNTSTNFHVYNQTANSLLFGTGGSEKMRIDSSGNVGIGTSSPSQKLDVTGGNIAVNNGQANLNISSSTTSAGNEAAITLLHAGNNSFKIKGGSDLIFESDGGANERVRITTSGNVGIGTTNPSSYQANADDLVVATAGHTGITIASGTSHLGNIHFADGTSGDDAYRGFIQYEHTANYMRFATNASEAMRIDSSGKVGIGMTSPLSVASGYGALTVGGSTGGGIIFSNTSSGHGQVFANSSQLTVDAFSSRNLTFQTNGSERMRIDSSGNLLVGTTDTTLYNDASDEYGIVFEPTGESQFSANNRTLMYLNRQNGDGTIVDFRKDGSTVGSIGNNGANIIYFAGAGSGVKILNPSSGFDGLMPSSTTGADRDALMDLGSANTRFKDLYLSGGAYLGGTGSANKLDDYEEGSWTGTLTGGTSAPSTAQTATGYYTKIGGVVTLWIEFSNKDITGASGAVKITGQPFTPASGKASTGAGYASRGATTLINSYFTSTSGGILFINYAGSAVSWASTGTGTYVQATITFSTT